MEPTTAERWQRLESLFAAALERSEAERLEFLNEQCGDDAQLLAELNALMQADEHSEQFLEEMVEDSAAALVERAQDWVGRRLGPYRVLREIGRGGMSSVYAARRDDTQYRKEVAIKLIRRGMDTEDMLRRFRDERQILAALEHPNIARLYDGGTTEDGLPYFVLEYVEGLPIDVYCDQQCLGIEQRIRLFRQVCAAVYYAHSNLIVHRDLKPSNVLVTADGVPKLLDFGIAKWLDPTLIDGTRTEPNERPMTPRYASPEQMSGQVITTASDVYSLGVMLYELLTCQLPHVAKNLQDLQFLIHHHSPQRPSSAVRRLYERGDGQAQREIATAIANRNGMAPESLRRALKGDIDNILLMALRREPARRYHSVEQFSADLKRHLAGHPVIARPDTWHYRASKFVRRHRLGVLATTMIVVLSLALIGTLWVQSDRVIRERDRATSSLALVNDLFEIADPGEVHGSTITALELLDRGASRVAKLADEPDTAVLLDTLARLYEELGLYPRALPLRERALEITQQTFGSRHREAADAMSKLARSLAMKGNFVDAERVFRRVLTLRRELQGAADPRTVRDLNGLALTLHDLGDYQQAAQIYEEGLAIFGQLSQEAQAEAFLLSNVALLYYDMGEYALAEKHYLEVLAGRQKVLGLEHPKIADVLDALGMTLTEQGRYQEAEELLRKGYRQRLKLLGEHHRDIARSRTNLGRLLIVTNHLEEASELLLQAWEHRRSLIGESHPEIAATLEALGSWHLARNENVDAEKKYRNALQIYRDSLPQGHPLSVESLLELGYQAEQREDYQEAEGLFREALEIRMRVFRSGTWPLAETQNALGRCLAKQGKISEARPLLQEGLQPLLAQLGSQHPRTRRARERNALEQRTEEK